MNNFYQKIQVFRDFKDSTNPKNFVSVPKDWYMVITDVVMSTLAIENGQYKSVNAVGAAVISAILNLEESLELPFIFGGDGATLLIPPQLKTETIKALQGVKNIAKNLDLDLRASILPVAEIYNRKGSLLVSKHQIGPKYTQAIFSGNGFDLAEKIIKDTNTRHLFEVMDNPQILANIKGFSCRWQSILSHSGETISLIIKIQEKMESSFYSYVFEKIEQIYGDSSQYHPINSKNLKLSFDPKELEVENQVLKNQNSKKSNYLFGLNSLIENIYGTIFDKASLTMSLENKKKNIIQNTDYRKFDGSLKMIISGNSQQRLVLNDFLEDLYQNGKIIYGIHVSDSALLTCLVFENTDKEVHFVDGNNGGYAIAAKNLKKQLKFLKNN